MPSVKAIWWLVDSVDDKRAYTYIRRPFFTLHSYIIIQQLVRI